MDSQSEEVPPDLSIPFILDKQVIDLSPLGLDTPKFVEMDAFFKFYHKKSLIGKGTNGSVYLYEGQDQHDRIAVKIIHLDKATETFILKHFAEVRRLKDIPYLAVYKEFYKDEAQKKCYLIMDYYDSPNLKKKGGYLENDLKKIVKQILSGLSALHNKKFYHRDIKPENILYKEKDKRAIIVDLGVGRRVEQKAHSHAGTPAYRAPEMNIGGYDFKVDIWALGITIYEVVCGVHPFGLVKKIEAENEEEIDKAAYKDKFKLEFKQKQWQNYSNRLQELIKKMLEVNPKKRYDSSQCLSHSWFLEKCDQDSKGKKSIEMMHIASENLKRKNVGDEKQHQSNGNKKMMKKSKSPFKHLFSKKIEWEKDVSSDEYEGTLF